MITLTCIRANKSGRTFIVDIEKNERIGELKEIIAHKLKYEFVASELRLYLAKRSNAWLKDDDSDDAVKQLEEGNVTDDIEEMCNEENEMESSWSLQEWLDEYKMPEPKTKEIHILVKLPKQHRPASDAAILERLMPVVDGGWFRLAQIPSHSLPLVEELEEFIKSELPVKIGMHRLLLDKWTTRMNLPSPALISKIFKIDNAKPCLDFCNMIINRIVYPIKPGDTETSFISFWDDSIRHVLNFVSPGIKENQRYWDCPNYVFIIDSVCVLRGNEEAPGACMRTARRELYEKLIWSHGSVPYLFGYTAIGFDVRLYAITDPGNVELGAYNLNYLEGRFRLLLAILNITRLFQGIVSLCPLSGKDEFRVKSRQNGIKILLQPTRVIKCFPESEFEKARHILEPLYTVLRDNRVPNVDRLVSTDPSMKRMVFEPRGIDDMKPSSLEELFHALRDILSALVKLHALSWMHRDIQWPNVVKSRDGSESWFLIDFMDAATSPQDSPSGQHLSRKEHAPEIFNGESHTTAVDMWSLGRLIRKNAYRVDWYDYYGCERTKFVEQLMHSDPSQRPSAAEALVMVGQLEEQYLARKKRKIEIQ